MWEEKFEHPKGDIYLIYGPDDECYDLEVIGEEGKGGSLTLMTSFQFEDDSLGSKFMECLCYFMDQQQYPKYAHYFTDGQAPLDMAERAWLVEKLSEEKILAIAKAYVSE